MGKIRILDDHIANQIAAGEVVERPSSVVKELVENAIDAGSTTIDVTIEEGGLALIRVADNGSGIEPDDLDTAFSRHATSKLGSGKDLFRIATLGFRGEALPSIAAVAKVECVSATDAGGAGRRIVIEGGTVKSQEDTAAPKGTDIRVKELFYNTPARLKYMKTIQTELGHVSDYMYRLALSHPDIAFSLKHNGSILIRTLGNGDLLQVIAAVYGTGTAKQMTPVAGESLDYAISGYVSLPELTRSNRNAISTIVNGRYIRNYTVAQALLEAYHTLLPIGRFPLAVLHLQMDPSLVDVNVHPAKLEVRFSKEAELTGTIRQAVRIALERQVLIPSAANVRRSGPAVVQEQLPLGRAMPQADAGAGAPDAAFAPPASMQPPAAARDAFGVVRETAAAAEAYAPLRTDTPTPRAPDEAAPQSAAPRAWAPSAAPSGRPAASSPASAGGGAYRPTGAKPAAKLPAGEQWLDKLLPPEASALPAFPMLSPIGQLHGTYIVAQNDSGLFLIDQHAAHERINYEHYYELFGRPAEASQQLAIPITLDFTPSEAELMKSRLPLFEQVGVYLEPFGGNTFIVRAYPHWFPAGEEKRIIDEMAEWALSEKKSVDLSKLREKASILCSCKASIKANQPQSVVHMEALLDKLAACRNPYTCPHGRPIVVSFSSYELEKMFKRVM